ncbi:hypothetical protein GUJ93_ZPchr0007g4358 [Zizania palustris]|uniref:Uncharacterized protein n=1 Tax=Zizania palustris TaxID=103762 RepID=A0A8J5T6B2_ZIZPA|nr:hypothetical protein GUJ93_ZPchr0007g4358 [Zizania palustris]
MAWRSSQRHGGVAFLAKMICVAVLPFLSFALNSNISTRTNNPIASPVGEHRILPLSPSPPGSGCGYGCGGFISSASVHPLSPRPPAGSSKRTRDLPIESWPILDTEMDLPRTEHVGRSDDFTKTSRPNYAVMDTAKGSITIEIVTKRLLLMLWINLSTCASIIILKECHFVMS